MADTVGIQRANCEIHRVHRECCKNGAQKHIISKSLPSQANSRKLAIQNIKAEWDEEDLVERDEPEIALVNLWNQEQISSRQQLVMGQ